MEWTTTATGGPGFRGRFDICFGSSCPGLFTQILRRRSGPAGLECEFAILYPSAPHPEVAARTLRRRLRLEAVDSQLLEPLVLERVQAVRQLPLVVGFSPLPNGP